MPVHPLTCTSWSLSRPPRLPWWRPRGVPVWLGTQSVGSETPAVAWWSECYPYPDAAYVGWCKSPEERIVNSEHTKISITALAMCTLYVPVHKPNTLLSITRQNLVYFDLESIISVLILLKTSHLHVHIWIFNAIEVNLYTSNITETLKYIGLWKSIIIY